MKQVLSTKILALTVVVGLIAIATVQSQSPAPVKVISKHDCECQLASNFRFSRFYKLSSHIAFADISTNDSGELELTNIRPIIGQIPANTAVINHISHLPARVGRAILFLKEEAAGLVCQASFNFAPEFEPEMSLTLRAMRSVIAENRNLDTYATQLVKLLNRDNNPLRKAACEELAFNTNLGTNMSSTDQKLLRAYLLNLKTADTAGLPELIAAYAELKPTDREVWIHLTQLQRFDRIRVNLANALKFHPTIDINAELQSSLTKDQPLEKRWNAAWLLARGRKAERQALIEYLQDEQPDIRAEALIALAGLESKPATQLAYDMVRKQLLRGKTWPQHTELQKRVREKHINNLRFGVIRADKRLTFAAVYHLSRSKASRDRAWLKGKVNGLRDPALIMFAKATMRQQWSNFDTPW